MKDASSHSIRTSLFRQSPWVAVGVVLISVTLMVTSSVPIIAHLVTLHPWGVFGFTTEQLDTALPYEWLRINDVASGGAADRAGVKPGDLIDMRETPFQYHRDIYWLDSYAPGKALELHVVRAGKPLVARLVSQPQKWTRADRIAAWLSRLRVVVLILTGLLLLLLRPSKMTWGFYIFSISSLGWRGTEYYLPWDWAIGWRVFGDVLNQIGPIGFLAFAIRFPRDVAIGWKRGIDAAMPYLYLGFGLVGLLWSWPSGSIYEKYLDPELINQFAEASTYVIVGLAAGALVDTLLRSSGDDRQRLRWVVAGCIIGFASYPQKLFLTFDLPGWEGNIVFNILPLLIPLAVAYGVLKHRVLDLRFVVARSLLYVLLVAGFIAFLGVVDWLGLRFLSEARFQVAILVVIATLFGFALGPLARRARNLIDRIYFRAHFDARERLAAHVDAVRRARSSDELESLLTSGVADALGLTSAAAFLPQRDGGFARGVSVGWPNTADWHVLQDDPAAGSLNVRSVARIDSRSAFPGFAVPEGPLSPVLTLPVRSNGHVYACFVYGAHINGADINSEEITELRWIATEAGITWRSIAAHEAVQDDRHHLSKPLAWPDWSHADS
jgi:hypothetical protein